MLLTKYIIGRYLYSYSPTSTCNCTSHTRKSGTRPSPHYCDVIMSPTSSQITSLKIVYSIVYSGTDQRKHQSSASLAFVRGIHQKPVKSPHKWPVTRKMFPFDDVIMCWEDVTAVSRPQSVNRDISKIAKLERSTVAIFFHTSQNLCSAMKNLCSDVPSGPPTLQICLSLKVSKNAR